MCLAVCNVLSCQHLTFDFSLTKFSIYIACYLYLHTIIFLNWTRSYDSATNFFSAVVNVYVTFIVSIVFIVFVSVAERTNCRLNFRLLSSSACTAQTVDLLLMLVAWLINVHLWISFACIHFALITAQLHIIWFGFTAYILGLKIVRVVFYEANQFIFCFISGTWKWWKNYASVEAWIPLQYFHL